MFFASCESIIDETLTEDEIVKGLKVALEVGTDSSSTVLSSVNGYYGDELVKILLPPEAENMLNYVSIIEAVAGTGHIEETIKSINRSAEDAANDAKPIFIDAIASMTIKDGLNILKGKSIEKSDFDSIAATNYLRTKTFENLTNLYSPKINAALDKDLLNNGLSANDLWTGIVLAYNGAIFIHTIDETPIDNSLSLGKFTTEKALDGLFFKVGEEEKKIRKNPYSWALDIIKKVFGSVYEEEGN